MVSDIMYPDRLVYEGPDGKVVVQCRFRPVKNNTFRKKQDGTDVQISHDIAFPAGTRSIQLGTVFNAINERGEEFIYQQELLSFHVGRFHCLGTC